MRRPARDVRGEALRARVAARYNWIVKAFYEVTDGDGTPQRDPELIRSAELLPDMKPLR